MAQTESANKTVNILSNNNSVVDKTLAEYVHVLNSKAIAFFYTGNFEEAIALSDQALAIDPNDVDALNSKAHALIGMGEYNQAIAFFDKVLAIDHNNIDALDDKHSLMDPDAIAKWAGCVEPEGTQAANALCKPFLYF